MLKITLEGSLNIMLSVYTDLRHSVAIRWRTFNMNAKIFLEGLRKEAAGARYELLRILENAVNETAELNGNQQLEVLNAVIISVSATREEISASGMLIATYINTCHA